MPAVMSGLVLDSPRRERMFPAVLAAMFGWSLDLFDLFILLYIAPLLGKLFFPAASATLSLAAVYASFAVTLLMRPVGSALFGTYADRRGRKKSLITAMLGAGLTTAAFGALPTIAQAGLLAPVLFLSLRLVQGLFIGGVVASSHTIGTETVPERWRGAMSGLVGGGGSGIGALLASLVYFAASELFPGAAFAVWGWRMMFFSGILSAIFGLCIFRYLSETPLWTRLNRQEAARRSPLGALFSREYRGVMLVNLALTASAGAGYYLTSGFLPAFLKLVVKLGSRDASLILIICSLVAITSCISIGHLSTYLGRRKTFIAMGVLRICLLPLCFLLMVRTHGAVSIGLCAMLLVFLGSGGYAPLLIFLNERFPTALRATGTGLCWNLGFAIGGVMPALVSLASPSVHDLPEVLSIFLFGSSVMFLLGACIMPETQGNLR